MGEGILDDFRQRVHAHLMENAGFVSAYCLDAQMKLGADFRDGFAFGQQVENLEFPVRQLLVRQFLFGRHNVHSKLFCHFHTDVGAA